MTRTGVDGARARHADLPIHLQSWHVTRAAAFFDLDKTVIAKSSTLAFGRPFFQGGLINRRAVLKGAYAQFVFSLAGADAEQMERMRGQLTAMVTGWDVSHGARHRPRRPCTRSSTRWSTPRPPT